MKVSIAADHRGFKLKKTVSAYLAELGHEVVDCGTYSQEPCDYPDYVVPASRAVRDGKAQRGIIICYTGIGSAIAANKVHGVRAALVYNIKSATLTRQHNNSNVLVLPSCLFTLAYTKRVVKAWLSAAFEGGRHARRVRKIRTIEEEESKR